MFDDAKEELERLNSQLLEQEEEQQEQMLDEDTIDSLLDESEIAETCGGYQNFSNGYKAYNTDKADLDLEDYSQEVLTPQKDKSLTVLSILAYCLSGAILLVLLFSWLYLRQAI